MMQTLAQSPASSPPGGDPLAMQKLPVHPKEPPPPPAAGQKLSKRARQRKGEYLRKLEDDNKQLKQTILEFEQKIGTIQAQNEILSRQLQFFQGYLLPDAAPPQNPEKG
jgi:hypothetical protein